MVTRWRGTPGHYPASRAGTATLVELAHRSRGRHRRSVTALGQVAPARAGQILQVNADKCSIPTPGKSRDGTRAVGVELSSVPVDSSNRAVRRGLTATAPALELDAGSTDLVDSERAKIT